MFLKVLIISNSKNNSRIKAYLSSKIIVHSVPKRNNNNNSKNRNNSNNNNSYRIKLKIIIKMKAMRRTLMKKMTMMMKMIITVAVISLRRIKILHQRKLSSNRTKNNLEMLCKLPKWRLSSKYSSSSSKIILKFFIQQ